MSSILAKVVHSHNIIIVVCAFETRRTAPELSIEVGIVMLQDWLKTISALPSLVNFRWRKRCVAHVSIFVLYAWVLVVVCFDLCYASIGELLSICMQMPAGWSHLCDLLTMSCLHLIDYLCVLLKEMLFVGTLSSIPRLHFFF